MGGFCLRCAARHGTGRNEIKGLLERWLAAMECVIANPFCVEKPPWALAAMVCVQSYVFDSRIGERRRWMRSDAWDVLDTFVGLFWVHSVCDSEISLSSSHSRSPLKRMPLTQAKSAVQEPVVGM